ncbi:MAG: tetratricopeptide repeat protein [Myxococcales bacterium]|nr:MAG: tetratricopeptide repeat protein [Myxococcales bacterium]
MSILCLCSSAQAQRNRSRSKAPKDRERALVLFERSEKLYQDGKFTEAAVLLKEAYDLEKEAILLYNLARALESAGKLEEAITAYEQYIQEGKPGEREKGSIESRVQNLKTRINEEQRIRKERDEAQKRQEEAERRLLEERSTGSNQPTDTRLSPWPWVIAAVGVVGLGAGGVLAIMSANKHDDAKNETVQQTALDLQNQSEDLNSAAIAAFIAGGVITAAGVTWGIIDIVGKSSPSTDESDGETEEGAQGGPDEPTASIRILPGSISLSGTF